MRILTQFIVLSLKGEDGNNQLDEQGYEIPCGFHLDFEEHDSIKIIPPSDLFQADWGDFISPQVVNIVLSENCKVDKSDQSWLDWFMSLVEIDNDELDKVTDHEIVSRRKAAMRSNPDFETEEMIKERYFVPGKTVRIPIGWEEGRILSAFKTHRGKGWGKCYYQVICEANGAFRLIDFRGDRTDLKIGTYWVNASEMFRALSSFKGGKTKMSGNRRQGHRLTINRFFDRVYDDAEAETMQPRTIIIGETGAGSGGELSNCGKN